MSHMTTRLTLPVPDYTDGPRGPDVPYWFEELGRRLDTIAVSYDQGRLDSIPRVGTVGRIYYATDLGVLYYDDGRKWRPVTGDTDVQVVGGNGPGYVSPWRAADAARPLRFWKEGRRVYLAGATTGRNGTVFTLPVGYRPRYQQRFQESNLVLNVFLTPYNVSIAVTTAGLVTVTNALERTIDFSFDGISFDLER